MAIAAVGVIRLPDFYIRNSASTKAVTLGLGLVLLGAALHFNQILLFLELLAILFFIVLINPLAAQIVARAAFKIKVPFWKKTDLSELENENEVSADGDADNDHGN